MSDMILYFAYGSNMNRERMKMRCPSATEVGKATLHHYRLVERLYADIDFEDGCDVNGMLYLITQADMKRLDAYEGYPHIYRKLWLEVEFRNEIYHALVYEMSLETKRKREGLSYPDDYRQICATGARQHHIKDNFTIRSKKKMNTVKIVCYGTLMTGERNHRFCRNAVSIKPCTFRGTLYDTGWGFPAVQLTGSGTVHGEIMEVPIADWPGIDRLEGYPRLYDREEIEVVLEDGTADRGWVYVMNDVSEMAKVIPGGNWKGRNA